MCEPDTAAQGMRASKSEIAVSRGIRVSIVLLSLGNQDNVRGASKLSNIAQPAE
jgi:hypothetical protein